MDLTQISNHEILNRVEKLARTERKITHLILWHLVEVETRRLYLELGYTSLFKYLTAHLSYSEDAAYRRIQASRLLKKMPQLEKSLETGDLNLTQLQQVQKCLTKEQENGNKVSTEQTENILTQIQNKSSFETQKILAVEFNQPIEQHESLKPQRDESVLLQLTFTNEQMIQLQHAKELLSHVLPSPTWAELISYLAKAQIQKRLGKESVALNVDSAVTVANKRTSKRKNIKISTRRFLLKKAQHHCEYHDRKLGRCDSKYQLQIDHRMPLALGGSDEVSNLRVLCRQHNIAEAQRWGLTQHQT